MASGFHYSFRKVRGIGLFPGFKIEFAGRAPEGVIFSFNNEDTSTYTADDDHGVHVDVVDIKGGACVINLQATCLADNLLEQMKGIMETTGGDLKGIITFTDIGGTGTVATTTNAKLSNRPGITYAAGQPIRGWKFTGDTRIIKTFVPPIVFGVANAVPPFQI